MKLHMVGCSHHNSSVRVRERISFNADQARSALVQLRERFPESEAVLLSTCNRTEVYLASQSGGPCPSHHDVVAFLAEFHGLNFAEIFDALFERTGEDAVRHLFTVASSLDSMVVGEAQILSQVKQAYEMAQAGNSAGPLTHLAFQAAIRVAKRVASETAINHRRVSIPSIAVADFASQFFERFDDKQILVVGAGEMGEETLRYLINAGACQISIVNRRMERAELLAVRAAGTARPWEELRQLLVTADLVVSTTASTQPVVSAADFALIERQRFQKALFILDLAVPRDFDPAVGQFPNVYLFSLDDLEKVCQENRLAREKEWPKAERIIEEETARFMTELHHRTTSSAIRRLKAQAERIRDEELTRLLNKIKVDNRTAGEVQRAFDRLINKLLHPPLESLRDEAQHGAPQGLLDALKRLFQLKD